MQQHALSNTSLPPIPVARTPAPVPLPATPSLLSRAHCLGCLHQACPGSRGGVAPLPTLVLTPHLYLLPSRSACASGCPPARAGATAVPDYDRGARRAGPCPQALFLPVQGDSDALRQGAQPSLPGLGAAPSWARGTPGAHQARLPPLCVLELPFSCHLCVLALPFFSLQLKCKPATVFPALSFHLCALRCSLWKRIARFA